MAHTYTTNLIHCVFSTKNRERLVPAGRQEQLWSYIVGIGRNIGVKILAVGGTDNHVHLLVALPATSALADVIQKIKGNSSRWMGPEFGWQKGCGSFSVSPSQASAVRNYIRNQAEHHKRRSFEEEFIALLKKCGVEYDPRYVFG